MQLKLFMLFFIPIFSVTCDYEERSVEQVKPSISAPLRGGRHRKRRLGSRVGTFPLKGTSVFWLPKNATEALDAVKASIAAIQRGEFGEIGIDQKHKPSETIPGSIRPNEKRNFGFDEKTDDRSAAGSAQDKVQTIFNKDSSNKRPNFKSRLITSSKKALMIMKRRFVRKDWCKTEALKQKIKEEGCVAKEIINRFCYGQCNSFYIPKHSRKKTRTDRPRAFTSCSFCKPSRGSWVTVTLSCPNHPGSKFKRRRVFAVKECKCMNEVIR